MYHLDQCVFPVNMLGLLPYDVGLGILVWVRNCVLIYKAFKRQISVTQEWMRLLFDQWLIEQPGKSLGFVLERISLHNILFIKNWNLYFVIEERNSGDCNKSSFSMQNAFVTTGFRLNVQICSVCNMFLGIRCNRSICWTKTNVLMVQHPVHLFRMFPSL